MSANDREKRRRPASGSRRRIEARDPVGVKLRDLYRQEVFSVEAGEALSEAASRMQFNEVGSLVVFESGRFVGIITERDLTRAVAEGADVEETPAREYMTDDPVVASPNWEADEAAIRMLSIGVRHLPVVVGEAVVGMVSARDLLEVLRFVHLNSAATGNGPGGRPGPRSGSPTR